MTHREKVIVSAYTGVLMCDFGDLHEYIEKILNRPVWTHELADEKVQNEIKEASKPEFIALCEAEEEEQVKPTTATRQKKSRDDDISTYQEYSYMRHPDRVEMGMY